MNIHNIWFITGVSSGFGRHLAEVAAKKGHTVIGTVRKPEQVEQVNQLVPGKTFGVVLDVNNHAQVQEVIGAVATQYGKIDVLVNNAGYGFCGAIEEASEEEVRAQMETNFFGAYAVTQAVLPVMRRQKKGHILQISSQAGINSTAGLGVYNASKFALEGFSEALYHEVAPLGIKVTLVEPGPFKTEWAGGSMKFPEQTLEDYIPTAGRTRTLLSNINGHQPGDPVKGAEAILHITETETPPLRLPLGKTAVEVIRKKLDWVSREITTWESLSKGADYSSQ